MSKYNEQIWKFEKNFQTGANMFILKILNIEAKQRKLILKCESSEAKLRYLFIKIN